MASLLLLPSNFYQSSSNPFPLPHKTSVVSASVSSSPKRTRRKRQQQQRRQQYIGEDENGSSGALVSMASSAEKVLRLVFMDELMERARNADVSGVSDVIYDMIAAGLSPGPRSFHGLIVSNVLNRDEEGAMHALRRELSEGLRPLHETFVALVRLFGSKGLSARGLEILAAMEKLNFDIRKAWLVLVEELIRSNHLEDANKVFLKGAEGGLRATDELYDLIIQEDCKVGDHENALTIAYEMESAGRMATTFHFNCLLSVQATCGIPEIAFSTFENMEYGAYGEDYMKPDTETYNWVIQAYTRADSYDRVQDVAELLGMMVEDHKRLQPNVRTYAYIAEGGLTGERKRWVPRRGKTPLDPDADGFIYSNPMETSFKQRCLEEWKIHHRKLLKTLHNEGPPVLGDVSESEYIRVEERLKKIIKGPEQNALKPKAASKMLVSELKEELEAQDLPTDGTRNVLYQRVQKARRINRSRGRPLWVPPVEEEEEEVDEELDKLISRIKLEEGNTEFWKRRFLGEGLNENHIKSMEENSSEIIDVADEGDVVDDVAKENEDDEADDEEEEVEQSESQEVVDQVKEKEVEVVKPLQMIGVQLLKDSDQTTSSSRKSRRKTSRVSVENDDDEDWFPLDIHEAFKEMRNRRVFDVSDMYTIADVWGWTWEKELKNKAPRRWSQEWEVELAVKIMTKVIELGGTPTIGDCAMILRAAIRAPMPSAFLKMLQATHNLGYFFGSPLYDEIISLCLDLGELDAAVAIVADLETTGIKVPDETLDRVISTRQMKDIPSDNAAQ
ncbi:uncharacterized protein LOC113783132 isoform X2 [Coffea eugenioides]|uniref:uncharacterized protein LOC113783132 isoform X2 n=1 Tax=Coffea eugenioides TaxID=49369 RepID=UPI000F606F0C|nr:uncharacterized protein LOC113783132 isoform X2 [Coffea eugenioides]